VDSDADVAFPVDVTSTSTSVNAKDVITKYFKRDHRTMSTAGVESSLPSHSVAPASSLDDLPLQHLQHNQPQLKKQKSLAEAWNIKPSGHDINSPIKQSAMNISSPTELKSSEEFGSPLSIQSVVLLRAPHTDELNNDNNKVMFNTNPSNGDMKKLREPKKTLSDLFKA